MSRKLTITLVAILLASASPPAAAQEPAAAFDQGRTLEGPGAVLPWRARVEPVNRRLEERLRGLLPRLMREAGIDLWLVINREYAEDPVFLTLVPEPVFAARRTTMLVFHDRGPSSEGADGYGGEDPGVELLSVSRYPQGPPYEAAWEGGDEEEQWRGLAEVIRERDPQRIGIDVSRHWPVADGLTASLRDRLEEALREAGAPGQEERLVERLVPAEELVVRWLETRTPAELEVYPHVVSLAGG